MKYFFDKNGKNETLVLVKKFAKLGVEWWGRIGTGIIELIIGLLLLIPATAFIGAFLESVLMIGAIFSHLLVIGIESTGINYLD